MFIALLSSLFLFLLQSTAVASTQSNSLLRNHPALPLGLWRYLSEQDRVISSSSRKTHAIYTPQWLDVPIDHFDPTNNATFPLRYWYDARFYKPGGPVFCLDGGETSGQDRLPFLDHGILKILSEATGGLSVVLEHRYYGESWPVPDLSTDNLRFLTAAQAIADNAYFTKHAQFPNTSSEAQEALVSAKWIHYGGSYAGAKVALLRHIYPDVVFGAIASSAVTEAIEDYWKYFEGIRLHANQACVGAVIEAVALVDAVLQTGQRDLIRKLKRLFGVEELSHDEDFASLLTYPLGAWQATNWDPAVSSTGFDDFCQDLLGGIDSLAEREVFQHTLASDRGHLASAISYLSNYASYIRDNVVSFCKAPQTLEECFSTFDAAAYQKHSLNETWRSWTWQYCSEWGFLQSAPPAHVPSLISRSITLNYTSQICRLAFPAGKYASVPSSPNTTSINQYGGFQLANDRIAFIDGSADPWLYATPHSPDVQQRESTLLRPFELIRGGVHHWDENGLRTRSQTAHAIDSQKEPAEIAKIHQREIEFVKSWLGME